MSDSSENLDPKEATEAKLCAYLEGELSPAERGEIEQHLSSNPQHRQLLADLAKTREWMRLIPTEMAPADLSQIFQQQVERSMLLDDAATASRSSMNRWPQVVLVAAIFLLTAGLGVVIVAMLRPPGSQKTFSFGKLPMPATTSAVTETKAIDAPAMPMVSRSISQRMPTTVAIAEAKPATPLEKLPDLLDVSSSDAVKAKLLAYNYHLPADQKAVGFYVASDATAATADQVRLFFGRHDLAFDNAITGGHETAAEAMAQAPTTAPTSGPSETIYVAHGVTPLQLELLSASLSGDSLNQSVKRLTLSEPPTTAPTVAASGAISKGQMLSVTIAQLVGPGIEKTNVTKVADDGTITLPMIDPVPAAGALPLELEQRIAAKYREANLISQATVFVQTPSTTQPTAVTTQPSTMPSTQPLAKASGTTQPANLPLAFAPAATQMGSEDLGINVVVMIEISTPK